MAASFGRVWQSARKLIAIISFSVSTCDFAVLLSINRIYLLPWNMSWHYELLSLIECSGYDTGSMLSLDLNQTFVPSLSLGNLPLSVNKPGLACWMGRNTGLVTSYPGFAAYSSFDLKQHASGSSSLK